jgi:hypothetical protein
MQLDARGNVKADFGDHAGAHKHDSRQGIRGRRYAPGPESHRVGDRRGPQMRERREYAYLMAVQIK